MTVTPTESRDIVLGLSRERLARASARLERVTRDAVERITQLKQEKLALERRLIDLETLFTQERQNFEQRAALLTSESAESAERTKAFEELNSRLNGQETIIYEQLETISKLQSKLASASAELSEHQAIEDASKAELADWKAKFDQADERLAQTASERDMLKSKIYESERMAAQYVLHFTPEERDKASKAIDSLIDSLSAIESRTLVATEEK
jgi:chromosome segregation ATPase